MQRPLVLASGSLRRRELVSAFAAPVELIAPAGEEAPPQTGEAPEEYVLRLSLAKAREVAQHVRSAIVLAADTSVVLDGEVLGKPASAAEATTMLARLRGRTHQVLTGVTVLDSDSGLWRSAVESTDVAMRRYSDAEIEVYVASGEPFDKAGGYAVQDSVFRPAESVDGCYLNVVGFPMCEVLALLDQVGAPIDLNPDWQPPEQCRDCPLQRERLVTRQ